MGILKREYLEKAGVFDEPSKKCPECGRDTEDPGDLCFKCQFDEKMAEEEK